MTRPPAVQKTHKKSNPLKGLQYLHIENRYVYPKTKAFKVRYNRWRKSAVVRRDNRPAGGASLGGRP